MPSSIKQVNIAHDPIEDRLLLRASTAAGEEFRVWMTRRYSILLLDVLNERIEHAGGMQSLASHDETLGQLRNGVFDSEYKEQTGKFPLGENGILGIHIKIGSLEPGLLALELLPAEGTGLNLKLDDSLLYLLHNLLEQAILSADWNVSMPQQAAGALH